MPLSVALPRGSAIVFLGRDGAPSPSDLFGSDRLSLFNHEKNEFSGTNRERLHRGFLVSVFLFVFMREIGGSKNPFSRLNGTGVFLFTIKGFAVFEKSNPIEPPVSHQKSANPFVLKARASGGFGFFRTEKMNHAMKNNPLKISSASYEVKTPLDSNGKNISDKFQPPGRSAAPRLC